MEATRLRLMGFGIKSFPLHLQTKLSLSPHRFLHNQLFSLKQTKLKLFCSNGTSESNKDLERTRPLIDFHSSPWGDHFLSLSIDISEVERLSTEIESEMKPKVRDMLISSQNSDKDTIRLIHLLISLGISHYFETEIEEILSQAFEKLEVLISDEEDDLETISIMFEVFRLYRHKMPCDLFNRFRGNDGNLKESLGEDVKGMLQLYEAAHLATPSEDIMDQALSFTRKHLEAWILLHHDDDGTSSNLCKHVQKALEIPRYQNIEILSAREYITFYNEEEDHNKTLLKFSKLNFKLCQLHYTQELKTLTKWWGRLDLASKLPFIRDRIVESFSVAFATYFEPRYTFGRIILTKLVMIVVVLDDACDAYGTLPEVKSLIDSLQRWDIDGIDEVSSSYMRILLQNLFETMYEIETEMKSRDRSSSVQYVINEIKSLGRAYEEISKWARGGHVPSFEEYMEVGVVSAGMDDFAAYSFVAMEDCDEKQTYDWCFSISQNLPLFKQYVSYHERYIHLREMKRGEVANGVNCYMKQHCVSKEEAVKDLSKMCRDNYKIMMEEFITSSKSTNLPRQTLFRCLNMGRQVYFFYPDHLDLYTYSQGKLKDIISSLFLPIP